MKKPVAKDLAAEFTRIRDTRFLIKSAAPAMIAEFFNRPKMCPVCPVKMRFYRRFGIPYEGEIEQSN